MAVDVGTKKQGGCPPPPPPKAFRPHPRPERPFPPPPPPPPFMPGPCCPPTNTLVLNNTIIKSVDNALKITEGYVHGSPAYFIEFDSELIKPTIVGEDPIEVKEGVFTEEDGSEHQGFLVTIKDMAGATDSVDGKAGSVPAPKAGEETKFLRGDGKWATITIPEVDQSDWTEQDSSAPSFIKHKPELATVATTGSYDDLSGKPSIPDAQIQSDWAQTDNTKVDYIKGKPSVFQGATDNSNGVAGFVPAPLTTDKDKFLCGNGSWADVDNTGMYDLGTKTESDLNNGKLAIGCGNSNTELTLTTVNALTVLANSGVANFALLVDNSGNSNDVTVTVKDSTDTTTFYQSTAAGNKVSAGKICQITCVGKCWTLAEFGTANA